MGNSKIIWIDIILQIENKDYIKLIDIGNRIGQRSQAKTLSILLPFKYD